MVQAKEQARWRCHTVLKKYREGETEPYEIREIEGNALQAAGITAMWDLIVGGGTKDPFNHANSVLAVYAATSWVNGTLDGASPETISGGKKWKASWTGASGDGAWTKWKVTNGTDQMNEKSEALGTKSGGTWTLEVSITLS